ncbi:MAG: GTPase Era [Chloroflexi bacterium]|nr:GTPase Era [Chloroflexota bacterium]
MHKSGFVAVIGKPNVGKSTLVNAFVGAKIAIVSSKPQTTRRVVRGILTRADAQIIFVDTPGIHQLTGARAPLLNRTMVQTATNAIDDVDAIVFVTDGSRLPTDEDIRIGALLKEKARAPVLLALNKMDLLKPANVETVTQAHWALTPHVDWMRVSASLGENLPKLLDQILAQLPEGPEYFAADIVTDQNLQAMAAEIIREQVLLNTRQEVPHAAAVAIDEWQARSPTLTHIGATIYVERESQKGIVIGARGAMLKQIGQAARQEIEQWLGHAAYLELWVKVWKDWRGEESSLRDLGLLDEK